MENIFPPLGTVASQLASAAAINPEIPISLSQSGFWNPHCKCTVDTQAFMAEEANISSRRTQSLPFLPLAEKIHHAIARIAESDCPILIAGERGVGKRLIATKIHAMSRRSRFAWNEIRGSEATVESTASALCSKGTVFLSEIADLSLAVQDLIVATYLESDWAAKSRLVCSTSHELLDQVKTGAIREDFYYLVSAVTLRISPLRCRKAEILSIADDLLASYSKQFDRPKPILHDEFTGFLMEHTWPDNLDELQTALKTFLVIGDQSVSLAALKAAAARANELKRTPSLKQATRAAAVQIERQLISEVLVATRGNRKRAADELGISYKTLLYKLKQAGINSRSTSSRNRSRP